MLFVREDYSMTVHRKDSPIVSYKLISTYYNFQIIATHEGVRLNGSTPVLSSQEDVDELFRIIQCCYRHHVSILSTGQPLPQNTLDQEVMA